MKLETELEIMTDFQLSFQLHNLLGVLILSLEVQKCEVALGFSLNRLDNSGLHIVGSSSNCKVMKLETELEIMTDF